MKYRLVPIILLFFIPAFTFSLAPAHANYRIATTATDTWPSILSQGYAVVDGVKMAMAENNGVNQIVAAGSFNNGTSQTQLRVYHKSGNGLVLDSNQQWVFTPFRSANSYYFSGVDVADIDGSGLNETVTIGNVQPTAGNPQLSQIGIYRWNGASLARQKLFNFTVTSSRLETRGLAIWSYSGVHQIVTLGYYNTSGINNAQLGIWSWDGNTFTKNALYNWTTTGTGATGSQGFAVATGDIEGIGTPDIVTVGWSNNGTATQSEMRIWGWTGSGNPLLKWTKIWVTTGVGSVATSVTIADLAKDGKKEIIVGGQILTYPFWKAELTLFSDWGGTLSQLAETNWISSSQSNFELIHVSTGDIDASGTTEIVTAGFTNQPIGTTDVYYGIIRAWTLTGSTISLQQSFQYTTVPTALDAVTIGDIDKIGKQDIIVGGQQIGKGFLEVRDTAFVNSIISLTTNPSPALAGQSVTVSGTLTNTTDAGPLVSMQVLLEYNASGGSYSIIATTSTDSQGRFATSFTPPGPGSYNIRASWSGDNSHSGSTASASLTVSKAPSVIVLSSSSFNAQVGDTITISGYLYPANTAKLTIIYTGPGGVSISHIVNSTSTGSFTDQYVVNSAGTWTVSASWAGTTTTSGSTSNTLNVQTQPQPPPLVTTMSFYALILAVAALAVGAFAIVRKGRGGTSLPSMVPTQATPSK